MPFWRSIGSASGPRPGSVAAIGSDPRGALIAELDKPLVLAAAANLPSSAKAYRTVNEANARRAARTKQAQQEAKKQQTAGAAPAMTEGQGEERRHRGRRKGKAKATDPVELAVKKAADAIPDPGRPIYLQEAKVRTERGAGRRDRLLPSVSMWFWSNHFCISANRIQSMSGAL